MRQITPKVLREVLARPEVCERNEILNDHECEGRLTFEHALTYSGRQINDAKAIVKLCEKSHSVNRFQDGGCLNKEINEWIALNRFTEEDFARYSNANFRQRLKYLNGKYNN